MRKKDLRKKGYAHGTACSSKKQDFVCTVVSMYKVQTL